MAPWVGPTNNDGPVYPTYDTDARWSYQTDGDVTTTGLYPTYGDDARWSEPSTQPTYPTYGDDARWSCTMDAMQCPDGTWVGRSGPNCEFVCSGQNVDPNGPPYPTYGDDTPGDDNGSGTQSAHFSVSPTSGAAPLTVVFSATGLSSGSQYIIDFGDGRNSEPFSGNDQKIHTYAASGNYTAMLQSYASCMWSEPRCLMPTQMLGSVTITVRGGNNNDQGPYPTYGDDARWSNVGINADGSANANNWHYNSSTGVEMNSSTSFSAFLQNFFSFWGF